MDFSISRGGGSASEELKNHYKNLWDALKYKGCRVQKQKMSVISKKGKAYLIGTKKVQN